ncbi:MAG: hypothetical protein KF852_09265 [Saprospiraceae bacterium]|nr:hypothetical protein [Saprospiraceae bacterium]
MYFRNNPNRLLFALTAMLLCGGLRAQVSASAALDSAQVQVGSTVALRVLVIGAGQPPGADYSALDTLTGVEVLQTEPFREIGTKEVKAWEQTLLLIAFEPGERRIPAIPVQAGGQIVFTEPLALTVLMPKLPPNATPAPIKDIIEEKRRLSDAWPWALGLVILAAAAWFFFFWKKRRKTAAAPPSFVPEEPPYEVAVRQLAELRRRQYWLSGELKRHYTDLTDILRAYLSRRFRIPALSETSAGILQDLTDSARLNDATLQRLERILHHADMVKFAKAQPPHLLTEELLAEAGRFLEETRPPAPPITAAT